MNVLEQFQAIIYSFIFGIIGSMIYATINRLFYRYKTKLLRLLLQVILGIGFALLYYTLLVQINNGLVRAYFLAMIVLGYIIYEQYYACGFLRILEYGMIIIKRLIYPIHYLLRYIHVIMLVRRVKRWLKKETDS